MVCSVSLVAQSELWFGTYTDEHGKAQQGRYQVDRTGDIINTIALSPYGQQSIDLLVLENDTAQNFVRIAWPDSSQTCLLIHYANGYYAGNCVEGTQIKPMVVKHFNYQDAELQGNFLKPSLVEVRIIEYALSLLSDPSQWNRNDDRVCSGGSYSLFCALYEASVKVDETYRHLRPAVKFVRAAIEKRHPKVYDHVLVDFNNAPETDLKEVHAILNLAKEQLMKDIEDH